MKKIIVGGIILLSTFLCGCGTNDNSSNSNSSQEHIHIWSEEICGERQICEICTISNTFVVEHNWSEPICEEKQYCLRCQIENSQIIEHTTARGNCERCGEYYISKENQVIDENIRHENAIAEIQKTYSDTYDNYYAQAYSYYNQIDYSESYVNSRISTLQSELSDLKVKLTLANLDTSTSGKIKAAQYKKEIQAIEEELLELNSQKSYWSLYKQYQNLIIELNNKYDKDIENENKLHEENLFKIDQGQ